MIDKKPSTISLLIIVIIYFFLTGIVCASENNKPFKEIRILILNDATDIKEVNNKASLIKSVKYRLNRNTSSLDIINFYDTFFQELGLLSTIDPKNVKWDFFSDHTSQKKIDIYQKIIYWRSFQLNTESILVIKYEVKNNVESDYYVMCQLHPYCNREKLNRYFIKLNKSNKLDSFMELVSQYRDESGRLNIEKLISENKNNRLIQDFKIEFKNEINKPECF